VAGDSPPGTVSGAKFRRVMGHFPTGVTIVTGLADSAPAGLTIGSFTSVSLTPPLVGFFPHVQSRTWAAMAEYGKFSVNVLGAGQDATCAHFAVTGGLPVLDEAIAWIDCDVWAVHEVGDHLFVVGEVMALEHREDDPQPLVSYRGRLGGYTTP
jgi:3-hydroxy-9,10-secoandrosta-1,3,5(10)-triene-9,17-dione monooxygenase reductase component